MKWTIIETTSSLKEAYEEHRNAEQVAIDTEFRRRDTFFPHVALMQICWGEHAYLVDPLKLDDSALLRRLLSETEQLKLIHSASEDLEVFFHWLGVLPTPLFDTQRAAAILGFGSGIGYRNLVQRFCEIELPKAETQSDWMRRPLSSAQIEYAVQDVSYLYSIGLRLIALAREYQRFEWIIEDSAGIFPGAKSLTHKFKTAYRLSPLKRRVLVGLLEWRDLRAKTLDRPRSWIISDKLIMTLAKNMPQTERGLLDIDGMSGGMVRRLGREIIHTIASAISLDDKVHTVYLPEPLSGEQKQTRSLISQFVAKRAEDLNIPPQLLMSKGDVETFIRHIHDPTIEIPTSWSGWRDKAVIEPLRVFMGTWHL